MALIWKWFPPPQSHGYMFFGELHSITILYNMRIMKIISYLCEILDDLEMSFETHHDIYLPADQCWHITYTLNF